MGLSGYWVFIIILAVVLALNSPIVNVSGISFWDNFIGIFGVALFYFPLQMVLYFLLLWFSTTLCIMAVSNLKSPKEKRRVGILLTLE